MRRRRRARNVARNAVEARMHTNSGHSASVAGTPLSRGMVESALARAIAPATDREGESWKLRGPSSRGELTCATPGLELAHDRSASAHGTRQGKAHSLRDSFRETTSKTSSLKQLDLERDRLRRRA